MYILNHNRPIVFNIISSSILTVYSVKIIRYTTNGKIDTTAKINKTAPLCTLALKFVHPLCAIGSLAWLEIERAPAI